MKFSKAERLVMVLCAGTLVFFALWTVLSRSGEEDYAVSGAHPVRVQPSQTARFYVPDELVDLNTASRDDLLTLPGVGEARAQAILDDRAQNGPFSQPQDLTRVSGIGEATYQALAPYVTVSTS